MNTQAFDEVQPRQEIPAELVLQSLHDGGNDDAPKAGRGISAFAGELVIYASDDGGEGDEGASGPKANRGVPGEELPDDPPTDDTDGPKTNKSVPADDG